MTSKKVLVLMLSVLFFSGTAMAASPWASEDSYCEQAKAKFSYGVKNLFGGWTALFSVPKQYSDEGKNPINGIGQGIYDAVAYTVGGVLHTGTFIFPQFDMEIKDGGVNL